MATDPESTEAPASASVPAPASATPTLSKKSAKRKFNPIRWFIGLNTRTQVLIGLGILAVVMVIDMRRKSPAASPPVQTQTPPPAPGLAATTETPPSPRFPAVTPSQADIDKMNKAPARPVENPDGKADRGVPDALIGQTLTPPQDDLAPDSQLKSSGVAPAGAPYVPSKGKKVVSEVMGVFASPAKSVDVVPPRQQMPVNAIATQAVRTGPQQTAELRVYAPYGRLVKCKLYNTIDSLVPVNCPIMAIVTEDLSWNGHVIIPALTEVYGYVDGKAKIDAKGVGRLFDTGEWTLVLPKQASAKNGREWVIKGRAMDRREAVLDDRGKVKSWSVDDAAPGMIGYTISTLDNELIKSFAAQFLAEGSIAAAEVGQTQQASPGMAGALGATQPAPTASNAGLAGLGAGTAASLKVVTDRIAEEIKQRGFYVRVVGGKEFYLFVEQTLDPEQARVGVRRDGTPQSK